MKKLHLIMPMGGAGSRFKENGCMLPKPLIEIQGKPFLYWATISIKKFVDIQDLTFIVLKSHINDYKIDRIILEYFPEAQIVAIPKVLSGPMLTCVEGVGHIEDDFPIMFNDCDHMFQCDELNKLLNNGDMDMDGALLTFISKQPQFSYVKYDIDRKIIGTVEKQVASNHAICGAYFFKNATIFRVICKEYMELCQYTEYFLSGLYNVMCDKGMQVKEFLLDFHVEFGTPDEYEAAKNSETFHIMRSNGTVK